MKVTINESIGELHIDHGGTLLVLHRERVSAANIAYAAWHGLKQRVCDAAAIEKTDDDGKLIPTQERTDRQIAAMRRIIDHLESGTDDWDIRATATPGEGGLLVRVLLRAGAKQPGSEVLMDDAFARAYVKSLDRKQQTAILNSPKLAPIAAELRAEAGKGVDVSTALADLGI